MSTINVKLSAREKAVAARAPLRADRDNASRVVAEQAERIKELEGERDEFDAHIADCLERLTASGAQGHDLMGDVTLGIASLVEQRDDMRTAYEEEVARCVRVEAERDSLKAKLAETKAERDTLLGDATARTPIRDRLASAEAQLDAERAITIPTLKAQLAEERERVLTAEDHLKASEAARYADALAAYAEVKRLRRENKKKDEAIRQLLRANSFGMSVTGGWDDAKSDPLYQQCAHAARLGEAALKPRKVKRR